MVVIRIIVCLACIYGIAKHLVKIVRLFYPGFLSPVLKETKEADKFDLIIYYSLAIIAMAYYIIYTIKKMELI